MKISKKSMLQGFMIFKSVYIEFEKRMQDENKGKETIQAWQQVFEAIEVDYKEANEDFLKAIKIVVAKNKYIPTIAEIIEEMKNIDRNRREAEIETKRRQIGKIEKACDLIRGDFDKAIRKYQKLKQKYSDEEIIKRILTYKKNRNLELVILGTEDTFEKIME